MDFITNLRNYFNIYQVQNLPNQIIQFTSISNFLPNKVKIYITVKNMQNKENY